MRLSSVFTVAAIFVGAGASALVASYFSAQMIETASQSGVLKELDSEGMTWAEVDTNGLQVFLIGTAPDEAERFRALATAGRVVDAARLIDQMLVEEPEDFAPPRFSIEILRNDAGISVIGLVPASTDRAALIKQLRGAAADGEISDLLESADFPAPEGWDDALRYAAQALRDLPRSKISVDAERVAIKAMADSEQGRNRLETTLSRRKPETLRLALDISAPRPVISPFALRFVLDADGARFDACAADTVEARDRILRAAVRAGLDGKAECTLGLGTPSRHWGDAAELAISKLAELGAGEVTFSNADIALLVPEGTDQSLFDRIVGELEAGLPEVFVVKAVLPKTPDASSEGPPEFVATLSPEGAVQMRGRMSSDIARQTADSYARALFGSDAVYTAARVAENMPGDWQVRTLAALEVLSLLGNGAVTVTPDLFAVTGKTGFSDAQAQIATLLVSKLGDGAKFEIKVEYVKRLDPTLGIPSPEECVLQITEIIGERKISFEPGSATFDAVGESIMDDLSDLMIKCGDIALEIGGHTDSQGRESMNKDLSQQRAQAVLNALRERLVPVKSYTVVGYGEAQPIADNTSEVGREANRRIEFKLVEGATSAPADPDAAVDKPLDAADTLPDETRDGAADAAPAATGNE